LLGARARQPAQFRAEGLAHDLRLLLGAEAMTRWWDWLLISAAFIFLVFACWWDWLLIPAVFVFLVFAIKIIIEAFKIWRE
jgi:hypothetical protein